MELNEFDHLSRRRLLLAGAVVSGYSVAGCMELGDDDSDETLDPTPTPEPTPTPKPQPTAGERTAVSIGWPEGVTFSHGVFATRPVHWIWFPAAEFPPGRASEPFEVIDDDNRWLAWPTEDGGIRCRVENDDAPGGAGFSFPIGRIGDLDLFKLDTETIHSDGETQSIGISLYIDADHDGEYLRWEETDEYETFLDIGNDVKAVAFLEAEGGTTIDLDTEFQLHTASGSSTVALAELKHDQVKGVSPLNDAFVHVSLLGSGEGNTEECVVHDATLERTVIAEADWPMYAHDKRNWGRNDGSVGPMDEVEPRWDVEIGDSVMSSPVVVEGTVYVGSDDGHLYAIDAADGAIEWTFETGGSVHSTPAVTGQTVYVGSDDATLYAISTNTADVRWTYEVNGPIRSPIKLDFDARSRVLDDALAFGSNDNILYLLDAVTGEYIGSVRTDGSVVSPPALLKLAAPNWVTFWGSLDGNRWHYNPGYRGELPPYEAMTRDAPVYAGVSGLMVSGEPWVYDATDAGTLTAGTYNIMAWTFEADAGIRTTPTHGDNGLVYIGSQNGTIYGITHDTGEAMWTYETGGAIDGAISIASDTVYLGSGDGRVYGLDADTGDQRWAYKIGDAVRTSPAVSDGTVYVGSDDGHVYALTDE